jgi:hypothetical protein
MAGLIAEVAASAPAGAVVLAAADPATDSLIPLPRPAPAAIRQLVVAAAAAPAPGAPLKDVPPTPPAAIPDAPAPASAPVVLASAEAEPGAFAARFEAEPATAPGNQELAFAAPAAPLPPARPDPLRILSGEQSPVPAPAPRRQASRPAIAPAAVPPPAAPAPDFAQASFEPWNDPLAVLTYTAVEAGGWAFWAAEPSTRQDYFARMERPAAGAIANLLDKPERSYAAGFGPLAYAGLRTDRFDGPLVAPVVTVSLDSLRPTRLASR